MMPVILPAIAILCAPALWVVFGRPRFLPVSGKATPEKISIIVPARDEEGNIGTLLESIHAQSMPAHEVIVVDDASTDRTAEIAQELDARVLQSEPLPGDWKGKPWACQQGAESASGEWLLFLDADTRLEPDTLAQLRHLTSRADHVFSICPWHTVRMPYEQLSAFFNVLMCIGMNAFGGANSSRDDTRLVGQCMLISQKTYRQCGGHAAVKSEILENYQLSGILKSMGIKRSCYLGKNSVSMRMFPGGFGELWGSWKKGFVSGAAEVPAGTMFWTSVWITGMVTATVSLIAALCTASSPAVAGLSVFAYLLHAMLCLFAFRSVGSFSIFNALLFPISLVFYHLLFFASLIDAKRGKTTPWKGRDVS